jgi:hypothetical protein
VSAVRWGRAIARLHEAGRSTKRAGRPAWPALVEEVQRLVAALTYGRLRRALRFPAVDPLPGWLPGLRDRLQEVALRLRQALLH